MEYPNSIPDLKHKQKLKKTLLEWLETQVVETKQKAQEANSKYEQTMSQYLRIQADFLQISAKLNEAQSLKAEFDETFKSALDLCIKKELKPNPYSVD